MKTEKSRIDELVNEKEKLLFRKERNTNSMHEKNSKIGTKIKKLENKSYRNKVATDDANAVIDRQVNKINKLIELEREYVNSLADSEQSSKQTKENKREV